MIYNSNGKGITGVYETVDDACIQNLKISGDQLSITDGNTVTLPSSGGGTWGSITGTLSAQTDLQTALNAKQDTITGLTASAAELNILDGATLSTTELNYVDGVTSDIQTQLNSKGTFTLPALTAGSVLFSDGSTIAQDNANFFWNDSTNRLGIGTATPDRQLSLVGGGNSPMLQFKDTLGGSGADLFMAFNQDNQTTIGWSLGLNADDNSFNLA